MADQTFYWIDITIALFIPLLIVFLRQMGKIDSYSYTLYWAGCIIGSLWEIPFYFIGPNFSTTPLYVLKTPIPYPLLLLHVVHCFWDGGLFIAGYFLVKKLCRPPHFVHFRISEIVVLLIWGGLQELVLELLAVGNSGWVFVPHWWNPVIFRFNDADITLLPQLVWVVAPIIFYLVALRLRRVPNKG